MLVSMNYVFFVMTMSDYQREAILRCGKCKHEWKIIYIHGQMNPCPNCEGFKTVYDD